MADLSTYYMGIPVKNPFVAGASGYTKDMDSIRKIEDNGAGAIVISSLFEEQIKLQRFLLEDELTRYDDWHAEMTDIFPDVKHSGPEEHLMWVEKAVKAVDVPVIGSLNCTEQETWVEWAKKMEETGCHGLELNFFAIPNDPNRRASDIESEQLDIARSVASEVSVPVSAKLSAFYTNPLNFITELDKTGIRGLVLFNRMFHPSIDIERESGRFPFNLSSRNDHRVPLRFVGLLHGKTNAGLCASNGIHSGDDALEVLLAGSDVFQAVSTLYLNGFDVIEKILSRISSWMDSKGYSTLDEFRGKLSEEKSAERFAYRRSQYVKMLIHSDRYLERPTLI